MKVVKLPPLPHAPYNYPYGPGYSDHQTDEKGGQAALQPPATAESMAGQGARGAVGAVESLALELSDSPFQHPEQFAERLATHLFNPKHLGLCKTTP